MTTTTATTRAEPVSLLLYGGPGAGKTATAVSSFWDWANGKQVRDGRLIAVGRENNPALRIPGELVRRFVISPDDPLRHAKELNEYLRALRVAAYKGSGPEVVVFDGFTEWASVYEHYKSQEPHDARDKWYAWRHLKDEFISTVQMLNPQELRAHVIATARVTVKRVGIVNKETREVTGADPEWVDCRYFPAIDGWARDNLSNYFNLVLYMDQDRKEVRAKGQTTYDTIHRVYMRTQGDFWVKNCWEHLLKEAPPFLDNPTFDTILDTIQGHTNKEGE